MKKGFILIALIACVYAPGMAQTCDTLFNLQSNLDTATVIPADTTVTGGYLSGNNEYGDVAKAEGFGVPGSGYHINSATLYFGVVTINPGDSNTTIPVYVWDNTGTALAGDSAPGNIIDSATITLAQIAVAVSQGTGVVVNFAVPAVLTSDTIFVGIVLPTTTGDTVALLTNTYNGPDGNGWEYDFGQGWNSYNNDWTVSPGSLGNYIMADICTSAPVIAYCDTLNNLLSALDTAVILAADTGAGAGYLSGNNIYGDLAKAESFSVPDTGYYITSATIFFGAVAINPTDTNNTVNINVWDNTGNSFLGDSAPGNVLNFTVVTLGEIAQAVTEHKGLEVYFPASASLAVDNLFVGVVLPTTAGDTVAIETNTYNGPDGNGWELNASGAWETYNYDWDVTPGSLGNYIIADICNAAPTPPTASFNSTSSSSCSPDTVTFADATTTTTTGYSFSWTFGDGGTANVQNPTYTYAAGGSYIVSEMVSVDTSSVVQVLVPGGGTVSILSSPVVMTNVLVADSENAGVGVADVSISGGSGYYLVTWSTGSFGDTVSAVTAGEYYATVTDQNTCVVTDSVYVPAVYGTGIVELSAGQQVKIYPIPASDVLTLQWSQRSDADITIVDLNGNVITSLLSYGDMSTVVHVGTLAAGNYVIRITDRTSDKQQSLTFSKL